MYNERNSLTSLQKIILDRLTRLLKINQLNEIRLFKIKDLFSYLPDEMKWDF